MDLILISGLSGSGKSVALHLLEDAGYYCVDNLPAPLLQMLVKELSDNGYGKVAVAVDVRGGNSLEHLPRQIDALIGWGVSPRSIFLDAKDETLLKRFSETRRRHPLATGGRSLEEAIREERKRLGGIAEISHRIDTSDLKANALRQWVRQYIDGEPGRGLILMFESFGFKHGIPLDADLVFDVRCLPNPYYDLSLRPQSGLDQPVIDFLEAQDEVRHMRDDIQRFIATWLPAYIRDNRNYLTVAIGCTGGQHRSVYFADWLGREFRDRARVLIRHRTLAGAL